MKNYIKPTFAIYDISAEDVITASTVSNSASALIEEMGLSNDDISIVDW